MSGRKQILYQPQSLELMAIQSLQTHFEMIPIDYPIDSDGIVPQILQKHPEARGVLVSPTHTTKLIRTQDPSSMSVRSLECCDFLLFQGGRACPMLILPSSIRTVLVKKVPKLDTTKNVYVVGQNKIAEIFIWTLLDMGFHHVKWLIADDDLISAKLEQLKSHFLGSQIELLHLNKLSHQETDGILLINVMETDKISGCIHELSYFNYLKRNSVMIDYDWSSKKGHESNEGPDNLLWSRSQTAGLFCISRRDIDLESANHFLH